MSTRLFIYIITLITLISTYGVARDGQGAKAFLGLVCTIGLISVLALVRDDGQKD